MFTGEKLVPEVYYDNSYDFRIYTKLMEVISNAVDFNRKELLNLRDPKYVRDVYVDLLKHYYPSKFPKWLSVDRLRIVLQNYWSLMSIRGTKRSLEVAANLAVNTPYSGLNSFVTVVMDEPTATNPHRNYTIQVTVEIANETKNYSRAFMLFLLNLVRPVGWGISLMEINATASDSYIVGMEVGRDYKVTKFRDAQTHKDDITDYEDIKDFTNHTKSSSDKSNEYFEEPEVDSQTMGQFMENPEDKKE